ncbi:mothers against decapentaplegic homolog 6 [Microcaecilia unicolor]|uniref:Mothers against decapentaplegic homolog n=1 Tax=Microcaecilia unicolor TaxID=1415580 RepID=A0A6P7WXQ7_9AMPH|nr:mothers against decapentaplegic homolog 6-like [Microcaecilia unicolor]
MFRSRRSSFVRRLWRHRCGGSQSVSITRGQIDGSPNPEESLSTSKLTAHSLFRRLKDEQLQVLAEVVQSKGARDSSCILVPQPKQALAPQLVLCRLYRWPDLRHTQELKRLCYCEAFWRRGSEGSSLCCNPYHFSRLCTPESPPPPYRKVASLDYPRPDLGKRIYAQESAELSNCNNSSRDWHDTTLSRTTVKDGYWCKLAYWEHRTRVGCLYAVHESSVNIFGDLPQGSGFCLGQLSSEHCSEAVRRTRGKIGQGLLLSLEKDGIWAYNRSEHPIFVNSPTLAPPGSRTLSVHKVLPGYSMKIFDCESPVIVGSLSVFGDGPWDPNSIRISFAKGWGPRYSRQFITSCPCWLEILLNSHR